MLKRIGKGIALFVLQMIIFAVSIWIEGFLEFFWIAIIPLVNLFFAVFITRVYNGLDVTVLLTSFICSALLYIPITIWLWLHNHEFAVAVPIFWLYDFLMTDAIYILVYIVHKVCGRKKEKLLKQEAEKTAKQKQ